MAEREYTSRIRTIVDADISSLTKELNKMESSFRSFSGLKGTGIEKGFESALLALKRMIKEYESLGDLSFMSPNDLSKTQRVLGEMRKAMSDLGVEVDRVKKKDLSEIFDFDNNTPAAVKQLYKDMSTQALSEIEKIKDGVKGLSSDSMGKNTRVHIDKILGFNPEGTAQEVEEMYARLVKARNAADAQLRRTTKDEGKQAARKQEIAELDELIEIVDSAKQRMQELQHAYDAAFEETKKIPTQEFENFGKAAGGVAKEVDGFGSAMQQAAQDSVSLAKQTQALTSSFLSLFSLDKSVQIFQKIIRDAVGTIKELDAAMTETAVVTDFSVGDMWSKLPEYTARANELGATTKGVYETMTLLYQQGLDTNRVFEIGTEVLQMARIAGLDYAHATDLMTAALRGFNMELNAESAQRVNDVYSNLAAKTASDTREIAEAMTKTASIAHNAGLSFETTAAFLTQAIETTREAPKKI